MDGSFGTCQETISEIGDPTPKEPLEESEDGQIPSSPTLFPRKPKSACKFYRTGNCFYGAQCSFIHPGITDKGRYVMYDTVHPNNLVSFQKMKYQNVIPSSEVSINVYHSNDIFDPYTNHFPNNDLNESCDDPWDQALSRLKNNDNKTLRSSPDTDLKRKFYDTQLGSSYAVPPTSSRKDGSHQIKLNSDSWKDPWMRSTAASARLPLNINSDRNWPQTKITGQISSSIILDETSPTNNSLSTRRKSLAQQSSSDEESTSASSNESSSENTSDDNSSSESDADSSSPSGEDSSENDSDDQTHNYSSAGKHKIDPASDDRRDDAPSFSKRRR